MAMRSRVGAAALGISASLASSVHAQPLRDFCPDRPGKGSPSCVVDPGVFQLEMSALDASFQRIWGLERDPASELAAVRGKAQRMLDHAEAQRRARGYGRA